jgi:hypothetical protein
MQRSGAHSRASTSANKIERANLGDGVGDLDQLGRRRTSGHDRMLMDGTVLHGIENQIERRDKPARKNTASEASGRWCASGANRCPRVAAMGAAKARPIGIPLRESEMGVMR